MNHKAIKATANCLKKAFKRQVEIYNETAEHKISVTLGWAEDYQDEDPLFFRRLFTRADGDMYSEKQRMKANDMLL